jgi:peptidyl-prolyl cis-trans isomerase D
MLQAIRKGTGSWITKGFLLVIVLSFAVWGVGDIIRGPRDTTVITVGSRDISASEFNREFQVDMRLLQARLSTVIPPEDVRRFGIVDATVRRFVDRSLLDQAVGDLDLAVADAVVEAIWASRWPTRWWKHVRSPTRPFRTRWADSTGASSRAPSRPAA